MGPWHDMGNDWHEATHYATPGSLRIRFAVYPGQLVDGTYTGKWLAQYRASDDRRGAFLGDAATPIHGDFCSAAAAMAACEFRAVAIDRDRAISARVARRHGLTAQEHEAEMDERHDEYLARLAHE